MLKFNFFHLMPYPYLPDDYDEHYQSMSLTYPNRHFDPGLGRELYHRYLDELEWADELGFDGIAVNEHHQTSYGLMPSPNIMAAALARRTSRAKIMVLGNAIPIRGNPLRVAEEIAMLDHLTDGRLVSGFVRGIGWEYFAHSINPTRSNERFDEAHDLIIKAWTSDEPFQYVTRNYEYRYVNIWPRPLQQPHPPIVMAGGGTPETARWAAKHHHIYMAVIAPTPSIKSWFEAYRRAAADYGWEPGPDRFGWVTPCYVGETDKKALADARGPIEWYFQKSLPSPPGAGLPPGYVSLDSMRANLESGRGRPSTATMSIEDLIDGGYVVVGSPDTVSERLAELQDTLGFEQLGVNLTMGNIAESQARENIEAFAKEVMPRFRRAGADL
jgi:alkanesulfonate monooxygenase SsuD/methylene tetrahydromethanopterin reductase-like flavin-dependent oxidoreductase (luciferase family)